MSVIHFSNSNFNENKDDEIFDPQHRESPFFEGPVFGRPYEIGHYSINASRKIQFDRSQMQYLITPLHTKVCFDLNINFDKDIIFEYNISERMAQILHWIIHNKDKVVDQSLTQSSLLRLDANFVTIRGTLRRIMCTPYLKDSLQSEWAICASKFNGTIYFMAIDTDSDIEKIQNKTIKDQQFQSWGYKFEQYMTSDTVGGIPNVTRTTHQLEEFSIVIENVLNSHKLLYSAEIDAVSPHFPKYESGNTSCYKELKTTRQKRTIMQQFNFYGHVLIHWWAQCYLTGISEVICGLRDTHGMVHSINIIQCSDMKDLAMGQWSPTVCLKFLRKFLKYLECTVVEDDPDIVYLFHFKPNMVTSSKLVKPEPRFKVIPEWFVNNMKSF